MRETFACLLKGTFGDANRTIDPFTETCMGCSSFLLFVASCADPAGIDRPLSALFNDYFYDEQGYNRQDAEENSYRRRSPVTQTEQALSVPQQTWVTSFSHF